MSIGIRPTRRAWATRSCPRPRINCSWPAITSARDLGGPLKESISLRDRINRGEIPGPTLYVAGPFLQHEPYPGTDYFRWGVKGAADARAKVKQLADAGVNIIKLIDQDEMAMGEVRAGGDE